MQSDIDPRLLKKLGMRRLPPTIDEFIDIHGDALSGIFPFWRERLRELFPTPLHNPHPFVILTGAIGIGKSTIAKVAALYNAARILCFDTLRPFGIKEGTKPIAIVFFHVSVDKAKLDFVDPVRDLFQSSPLLRELQKESPIKIVFLPEGPKTSNALGSDVAFYTFSEINFISDNVFSKIDMAFKRFRSRFLSAMGVFGGIYLDSSANTEESLTEEIIRNNPDRLHVIRASLWEVKPHLFSGDKIFVFIGDSQRPPRIYDKRPPDLPPQLVFEVPAELRSEFERNITQAIIDILGVPIRLNEKLFPHAELVTQNAVLPDLVSGDIWLNFYDPADTLEDRVAPVLREIREQLAGATVFVGIDLGITDAATGIALAYIDGYRDIGGASVPAIKVPLVLNVTRPVGQETSIPKIASFLLHLSRITKIVVGTDTYQSKMLAQDLKAKGIPVHEIPHTRTDESYLILKTLFMHRAVQIPSSDALINQLLGLLHTKGKVIPPKGGYKDMADALALSVFLAYDAFRQRYITTEDARAAETVLRDAHTNRLRDDFIRAYQIPAFLAQIWNDSPAQPSE